MTELPDKTIPFSLSVRLFGSFEIRQNDRLLPKLRSRKGQWLLALLLLREGKEIERLWLAQQLWPDTIEEQSAGYLRQSLSNLRASLGEESRRLLAPTRSTLAFDTVGMETDVLRFDALTAAGDFPSLQRAVELYRGKLLEGCEERWAVEPRTRRHQAYILSLDSLSRNYREAGRLSEAATALQHLIFADPLRESAYAALMRIYASQGDYRAALNLYHDLKRLLHRDVNRLPGMELRLLMEETQRQAKQARTLPPASTMTGQESHLSNSPTSYLQRYSARTLPQPLTEFIGRDRECAQILNLLQRARLVTLTGPGGIGKTRLALAVAHTPVAPFPDGVCFLSLANHPNGTLLWPALAAALGVREVTEDQIVDRVLDHLTGQGLLIILDNCEHLIQECAALAELLLSRCSRLTILATSRQSLGITGEQICPVPTLSLPPGSSNLDTTISPQEALQYAAVRLFVERAAAARPDFTLTEWNTSAVLQICRRLDGIALAIELAAARIPVLSAEQIAARLEDRFRLLSEGNRAALPRQQTLRALMDWSYDLLSESEKTLLCRLSVFSGGWTLEAAEQVCSEADGTGDEEVPASENQKSKIENWEILDLLTALADKSLIVVESDGQNGIRYRQLETIQKYSSARLEERKESARIRSSHAAWSLRFAEQAVQELNLAQQSDWLDRMEREMDNFRAAMSWLLQISDAPRMQRLTALLWTFWKTRANLSEARQWMTAALEMETTARTPECAAVSGAFGTLAVMQGRYEEAQTLLETSRSIFQELGNLDGDAESLNRLGKLAQKQGNTQQARALFTECLSLSRKTGFSLMELASLNNLGLIAYDCGDFVTALQYHQECLRGNQQVGNSGGIAWSLNNLAETALAQNQSEEAFRLATDSLIRFLALRNNSGVAANLVILAQILWLGQRDPQTSRKVVRLLGAVRGLCEAVSMTETYVTSPFCTAILQSAQNELGLVVFTEEMKAGDCLGLEEAAAMALDYMRDRQ